MFSSTEIEKLIQAMSWVIPDDESQGAGTPNCLRHLLALIQARGTAVLEIYRQHLGALTEDDLANPNHPLASLLIDQVKDAYYGYSDTGAWADIGFVVTA